MMPGASFKVLIIAPAWVGDIVMAQALLKQLKQSFSSAAIDVMVPSLGQSLVTCMPEVNQVLISPYRHGEWRFWHRYRLGKALRVSGYDRAYVLPNSWKSALVPWFARVPLRTGWCGEYRWGLLNDLRFLKRRRYPLMVERFVALALPRHASLPDPLPKPRLVISKQKVCTILKKYFLLKSRRPVLALCPGAEFGVSKRWLPEYFAAVAEAKLAEGWTVFLLGSSKEEAVAALIQEKTQHRCQNLVGRTNLLEAVGLISSVDAVLTNDSGLMHIAAALDIPQVVLYGSTSPHFTPPLSEKAKVLSLHLECSPCFKPECPLKHHRCMRDLSPTLALNALAEIQKKH